MTTTPDTFRDLAEEYGAEQFTAGAALPEDRRRRPRQPGAATHRREFATQP
jgi:hypothetical protein